MIFLFTLAAGLSALLMTLGLAVRPPESAEAPVPGLERRLLLDPVLLSAEEQTAVQAGRIVLREVPRTGLKGRTYEAVGLLPGAVDEVLSIIMDYEHYADFMPRVERVVVTAESDTVHLVEQYLKLPLGMHRRYRLRYTARRAEEGFRIDWAKVAWPEVPLSQSVVDTSGFWQVAAFGEGRLLAVYHVYSDPGRVPLGMKGLALSLSKHEIPKVVERVRERLRAKTKSGL